MTSDRTNPRVGVAVATTLLCLASMFVFADTPAHAAAAPPNPVTNLTAYLTPDAPDTYTAGITVSWTPAASGELATAFVVQFTAINSDAPDPAAMVIIAPTSSLTWYGGSNGVTYKVSVVARNAYVGSSSPVFAGPVGPLVTGVPADPVLGVSGTGGVRQLTVNWVPANTGVKAVEFWVIIYLAGTAKASRYVNAPTTSTTFTGIPAGVYCAKVWALSTGDADTKATPVTACNIKVTDGSTPPTTTTTTTTIPPPASTPHTCSTTDVLTDINSLSGYSITRRDCSSRAAMLKLAKTLDAAKHCPASTDDLVKRLNDMAKTYAVSGGDNTSDIHWWFYSASLKDRNCGLDNEQAAIAYGDLNAADYLAINIPGLGSSVKDAFPRKGVVSKWAFDGQRLYRKMDALRSGPVAVLSWMRYRPPATSIEHFDLKKTVISGDLAIAGARNLNQDLDKLLKPKAFRPRQVTLVGHSYGSLVVSYAQLERVKFKRQYNPLNTVFVGSPGVAIDAKKDHTVRGNTDINNGIDTAEDATKIGFVNADNYDLCPNSRRKSIYRPIFCLPNPDHVFTVQASQDPVTLAPVAAFGTPPHWGEFGGHRFAARNTASVSRVQALVSRAGCLVVGAVAAALTVGLGGLFTVAACYVVVKASELAKLVANHSHYFDLCKNETAGTCSGSLNAIASVSVGRYSNAKWVAGVLPIPRNLS